ncbi:hypothetical protein [Mycolicibacter minnesotensis]|uniref:hypothetical protein n=1 Tax=Mycolicibacter minnesotensis TaxID=1118379 RepID=UPI000D6A7594|nr:hypothetical protein [Mycolicibacter minnesotensis]
MVKVASYSAKVAPQAPAEREATVPTAVSGNAVATVATVATVARAAQVESSLAMRVWVAMAA